MSVHYLLDGYNILKQIPAFRDLPLEDGRKGFLKWIDTARPQGSVNNQVTVVFDGHPDKYSLFPGSHTGDFQKSEEIRVIFSDGCSADDKIKLMVEEMPAKKNCVVVSDDKEVFLYARSLGARVMSVSAFTSISSGKTKSRLRHPGNRREAEVRLSLSSQEKINKELARIWLKEKE